MKILFIGFTLLASISAFSKPGGKDSAFKKYDRLYKEVTSSLKSESYSSQKKNALELLEIAKRFKNDWSYGNAVHKANIVLGLIALDKNNIKVAQNKLLASAKHQGSPQLNNFGPNMLLAKRLLKNGKRKTVLNFLNLCRKNFWNSKASNSKEKISKWREEIQDNRIPDFGAHLEY